MKNTDISIKGYISIAGLVDVSRFGNTGNIFVDWYFDTMARCALNDLNYATSNKTLEITLFTNSLISLSNKVLPSIDSITYHRENFDLFGKLNKSIELSENLYGLVEKEEETYNNDYGKASIMIIIGSILITLGVIITMVMIITGG